MLAINNNDLEESKDRKMAIIWSSVSLTILALLAFFTSFLVDPPLPEDVPPLKSDEVIEAFMLDNVELEDDAGSSGGGGTPSDDKVSDPAPQTQQFVTSSKSDVKVNSGKSSNNTATNSNNPSTTTLRSTNPFGTGGDGGGSGSGSGGKFGNDEGNGNDGTGGGNGNGNGKNRIRMNDAKVDDIKTNVNVKIHLKLTVNENGEVVSAASTSKTTTTDQRIINLAKSAVMRQVRYNKDPGSGLVIQYYTIGISAN
jgi:hypothetical protein